MAHQPPARRHLLRPLPLPISLAAHTRTPIITASTTTTSLNQPQNQLPWDRSFHTSIAVHGCQVPTSSISLTLFDFPRAVPGRAVMGCGDMPKGSRSSLHIPDEVRPPRASNLHGLTHLKTRGRVQVMPVWTCRGELREWSHGRADAVGGRDDPRVGRLRHQFQRKGCQGVLKIMVGGSDVPNAMV